MPIASGGDSMRMANGSLNVKDFDRIIKRSRLKDLKQKKTMTSSDMGLDPRVVITLAAKGVIEKAGRVTKGGRTAIWKAGVRYDYYMKKEGWL
jgi:hypothetical protein